MKEPLSTGPLSSGPLSSGPVTPTAPDAEPRPFAHLQTQNAATYRLIMGAFASAKRRFIVHLRPEDVRETLLAGATNPLEGASAQAGPLENGRLENGPLELGAISDALAMLERWGNLRSDPDTSRVTTVEDFHRARYLYQLSPHGEAAEEALQAYDQALGRRGSLQSVALVDIAEQLRVLLGLARADAPDAAKVHLALLVLTERFRDLAANAQAFMGALARTIDVQDGESDAFLAYKDRLIDYLERFIKDLLGTGSEIAGLIEELEAANIGLLLDLAAERGAQDTAPLGAVTDGVAEPTGADGADVLPGSRTPDDLAAAAVEFARGRRLWQDRWEGIHAWFLGTAHQPSQAKQLRAQARASVPRLLRMVTALNERRSGRSDRAADFRALALWFAQAPDDAAMHRLWRSAFGLSPSRHLTIDADTLDARHEQPVSPATPWAEAPRLLISPRLRKTGQYERRGKPNRVIDRGQERRYLAERASREAFEVAEARSRLATGGPMRLSDLGVLNPPEFRLFLGLLGDALAGKAPGAKQVETSTSDGAMSIRLTELDHPGRAEIRTPHGVFSGPDHLVHIVDLTDTGPAADIYDQDEFAADDQERTA